MEKVQKFFSRLKESLWSCKIVRILHFNVYLNVVYFSQLGLSPASVPLPKFASSMQLEENFALKLSKNRIQQKTSNLENFAAAVNQSINPERSRWK